MLIQQRALQMRSDIVTYNCKALYMCNPTTFKQYLVTDLHLDLNVAWCYNYKGIIQRVLKATH